MNFWDTEGSNVKASRINEILDSNPNLPELFAEDAFMDEFHAQKPRLIEFLALEETIKQLLYYVFDIHKMTELSFRQRCDYPFYSYNILSNCNPSITESLYNCDDLMTYFFSMAERDMDEFVTSQGYFSVIFKNMLLDINPLAPVFVKKLKSKPDARVFPLVRNLSMSNAEIIKDIFESSQEYIKKLQNCIFEYLLFYFINEQFKENQYTEEMFENLNNIFKHLTNENLKFPYKLKYEYTLYKEKFVKNKKFKEPIYYFKLVLLNYLAKTKQIYKCENPHTFIQSYQNYISQPKGRFYLRELLSFFRTLSENPEFQGVVNIPFICELISILKNIRRNDIIHTHVFAIFNNIIGFINKDPNALKLVIDFLLEMKPRLKLPIETKKEMNDISLAFVLNLLNILEFKSLPESKKEKVINWKSLLQTNFTKLCDNGTSSSRITDLDESTDVKIINTNSFGFKVNGLSFDNRDKYEDEILEPEPLDSPTKLSLNFRNNMRDYSDSDFSESHGDSVQQAEKEEGFDSNILLSPNKRDRAISDQGNNQLQNDLFSPMVKNMQFQGDLKDDHAKSIEAQINAGVDRVSKSDFTKKNLVHGTIDEKEEFKPM